MSIEERGRQEWKNGQYEAFMRTLTELTYRELESKGYSEDQSDQIFMGMFNAVGGKDFIDQVRDAEKTDNKEKAKGLFEALNKIIQTDVNPMTSKYLKEVLNPTNPLLRIAIFSAVIGGTLLFLRR